MEKKTIEKLKKRGWNEEEIRKAHSIIESRHRMDKSRSIPTSNRVVFWTIFVSIIILNFLVSLTLVPFLVVFDKIWLDIVLIIIALSFGILFTFMINLGHISRRHQVFAGMIIPIVAIFNFIFITYLANAINEILQLTSVRQSPTTIAVIYVIAFIVPFLISMAFRKYLRKQ